jgi:hypothetical protein
MKRKRRESELLELATMEITSLKDLENFKKSSRELIKFRCEKCGKTTVKMVVNLKTKKKLTCMYCEVQATKTINFGDPNYRNFEQIKKTCLKKFGVENPLQSREIQEKVNQTNRDRYGSSWMTATSHFDKKSKETCTKKYGVERVTQDPSFIENGLKKKFERYGDVSFNRKYFYNEKWFDSSWELAYFIWLCDANINFEFHPNSIGRYTDEDGREHKYYPDFLVDGEYQEIKGSQFFDKNNEPFDMYTKKYWWNKFEFLKKNRVRIIRFDEMKFILKYISQKYGRDYLKSFKNVQRSERKLVGSSEPKRKGP